MVIVLECVTCEKETEHKAFIALDNNGKPITVFVCMECGYKQLISGTKTTPRFLEKMVVKEDVESI